MTANLHQLCRTSVLERPRQWRTETWLTQQGLHPLIARLLAARGVATMPAQQAAQLLPPHDLLGLKPATERLVQAISQQEKIIVVADYDCDGATACALAVLGLKRLGAIVDYVVPNRFTMGYGLSEAAVDLALQEQAQLIVTVDNGIASLSGVEYAQRQHVDVVITDHHLPASQLPSAAAIVNPNQPGCAFASKQLAGVGVMFYVLLGLRARLRQAGQFTTETQPRLDDLLDLVALGTVADLVKLDDNNRLLVKLGLDRMRSGQCRPGLQALARVAGREPRLLTVADLGFLIGPRLNAAGRLTDMRIGIECLLSENSEKAFELALQLDRTNIERREMQQQMHELAEQNLEMNISDEQRSIVLFNQQFHVGVIGLLASRLKDRYHLPTLVLAPSDNGLLTGSGRSIPGLHLRDVLDWVSKQQPGLLKRFGGHAMAAGVSLEPEHFEIFKTSFEQACQHWLGTERPGRIWHVDGSLETAYFHPGIAQLLENEIWGQGFDAPLFWDEWRIVSQRVIKDKHLKLVVERDGRQFDAIAFQRTEPLPASTHLAYRLNNNTWNGSTNLQLIIEYVAEPDD
ncbi:MAG: single-stranded-DNA-specific exonuclease RecJ [Burkholderiales bacterium]